jgi:hypothetical protein
VHWINYICTGSIICAPNQLYVHRINYACTELIICAINQLYVRWINYMCTESIHFTQWKLMLIMKVRTLPATLSLLNCNMSTNYMEESPSWKVDGWFVVVPDMVSVNCSGLWPPIKDGDSIYEVGANKLMESVTPTDKVIMRVIIITLI